LISREQLARRLTRGGRSRVAEHFAHASADRLDGPALQAELTRYKSLGGHPSPQEESVLRQIAEILAAPSLFELRTEAASDPAASEAVKQQVDRALTCARGARAVHAALAALPDPVLAQLSSLDLHHRQLTTEGWGELVEFLAEKCPKLTALALRNNDLAPEAVEQLAEALPKLERLDLSANKLEALEPKVLAKLTELTHLRWGSATEEQQLAIAGLKRLEELELAGCIPAEAAMEKLANRARGLRRLAMRDSFKRGDLTAEALEPLTRLPHLTELRLSGHQLADDRLEVVGRMAQLEVLELRGCALKATALEHLTGLDRLEALDIAENRMGDAGLAALQSLSKLVKLDLSAPGYISPDALVRLAQSLPALVDLTLRFPNRSQRAEISAKLTEFKGLRRIELDEAEDVDVLALAELPELKELKVGSGKRLTEVGVKALFELPLRRLIMCNGFEWTHLKQLEGGGQRLEELVLNNQFNSKAALPFLAEFPVLRVLDMFIGNVDGDAAEALARSKSLRRLSATACSLDDRAVIAFAGMRDLEALVVGSDYNRLMHNETWGEPGHAALAAMPEGVLRWPVPG
jgi:hypothetical protein